MIKKEVKIAKKTLEILNHSKNNIEFITSNRYETENRGKVTIMKATLMSTACNKPENYFDLIFQ